MAAAFLLLSAVMLFSSCRLTRMLPKGPVVSERERRQTFKGNTPSGVHYTGEADATFPAIPFMVFGVTYDLDLVLVSSHPKWNMHEYARVQTPEGSVWLAKDTRESDGDQLLVADIEDIETWLPEVPLNRKSGAVDVTNRSSDDNLDLKLEYENFDGEQVVVTFKGPRPTNELGKRNGSTMGHSRNQVMAVLDLPHRNFAKEASIRIGGKPYKIERVLGIKPLRLALTQTQGGLAEGNFDQWTPGADADEFAFVTAHHKRDDITVKRSWNVEKNDGYVTVRQESDLRTLAYRFRRSRDDALELVEAWVDVWNADDHTFHVEFDPALPDLRRPFEGRHRSRFVMDIAGQKNHAVGTVEVRSNDQTASLAVRADDPWWVADRCIDSTIRRKLGEQIEVETTVTPCG